MPLSSADRITRTAPDPGAGIPRRGYPREYRNQEGPRDNPRQNLPDWQTGRRGDERLDEIPAFTTGSRVGPLALEYNFGQRPARLNELVPPHPNDLAGQRDRWINPRNDPGPVRVVRRNGTTEQSGAIYHPEGNLRGYEPMRVQPLDREGRERQQREDRREFAPRSTF